MEKKVEFIYGDYKRIIDNLRDNQYNIIKYAEAGTFEKEVILRHDIDVSLEKAVEFARYEESINVVSTYYILLSSDFYNVFGKKSINCVRELIDMGHDIGLHFDETNYELEQYSGKERNNKLKELILKEKKILEVILDNIEIQSVSMHIPSKETLDAN